MSNFAARVSPALYMTKFSLSPVPYLGDIPNHRASAISLSLSNSVRVLGMVGKHEYADMRSSYKAKRSQVQHTITTISGSAACERCKNGRFLIEMENTHGDDVSPNSLNRERPLSQGPDAIL